MENNIMYNSIPNQLLTHPNQLTVKQWNDVVNILKTQANVNADYINNLHKWIFNDSDGSIDLPSLVESLKETFTIEDTVTINKSSVFSKYAQFAKGINIDTQANIDTAYINNMFVVSSATFYIKPLFYTGIEVIGGESTFNTSATFNQDVDFRSFVTISNEPMFPQHVATKGYVDQIRDSIVAEAPEALDTLKEIADILKDNENSIGDIIKTMGNKVTKQWNVNYTQGPSVYASMPGGHENVIPVLTKDDIISGTLPFPGINSIVGRSTDGHIHVSDPVDEEHAVNKKYIDTWKNIINKYFTVNEEHDNVLMEYEYIINWLVVKEKADFEDGFYSNTTASGDTYSKGLSVEHDINQFSMFGYDYNYTDGTYYTNRFNFENGGNVRVAINNPNAKFTYNDKEVATEQDVAYLEKKIKNLQASAEGSTFVYEEDSNISYQKDVPSGASPYAVLNKVGGMSYASSNLIELKDVEETTTSYGITYSFKNGILTINGTSTSTSASKILIQLKEPLPIGTYTLKNFVNRENAISKDTLSIVKENKWETIISFAPINQTYITTTTTELGYYLMYYMPTAQTYNNYKIIPMLVRGSTAPTKFVPYFEGIRNSAVTEINSNGANLLDLSNFTGSKNGISWYTENGRIYFSGTTTANTFTTSIKLFLPKGTYTLKEFTNNTKYSFFIQENESENKKTLLSINGTTNTSMTTTTNRDYNCICYVYINSTDTNLNGLVVSPMLVKGSTAPTEFSEYKEQPIATKQLPSAVTTLTDYGLGINEEYNNYIDLENKKYVRKVRKIYLKDLSWTKSISTEIDRFIGTIPNNYRAVPKTNFVCDMKKITNVKSVTTSKYIMCINSGVQLVINLGDYGTTTLEDFLQKLEEENPILIYPLETPIEEDISYLFKDVDEFIEVEELGSITFENEFEQNVPSTITYQVKI